MATIKIIPELEAASRRAISNYNFAERRCLTNSETHIRLPDYMLESQSQNQSQSYTNCLVAATLQQAGNLCAGVLSSLACRRKYLSQVGSWSKINGTSCYPACTRYLVKYAGQVAQFY